MKYIIPFVLCVLTILPYADTAEAKTTPNKNAFGVNMHLRTRIPEEDWSTVLQKASDAGVQWGREEFTWDVIEPSDDDFSWDAYDAVVDAYDNADIRMLGLLTYSSSWASSNPSSSDSEFYPPDVDAWTDYVTEVATRYDGRVNAWEIWNEPNHSGFWKGDVNDYAEVLAAAADAIHSVNPDATVVLGGLSGADSSYLNDVYEALGSTSGIDVVAIHPYRVIGSNFNYAPEATADGLNTVTNDIYNVLAVMRAHGQTNTPLWLTEAGWTTDSTGVSEDTQARYVLRLYAIALSIPQVKKVFWYDMTDTSASDYPEAHFGLLEPTTYGKKVSYEAYAFVSRHLNGRRFKDQFLAEEHTVDAFTGVNAWEFVGTQCTNGTVEQTGTALVVNYAFTGSRNCYAPVQSGIALPSGTRAVQFTANGADDDTFLRVRVVDSTGETFQYQLGYMPSRKLFYTVQLGAHSSHWGGDNDGTLDQPLTFDSFVFDDTDGSLASGTVRIRNLVSTTVGNTYVYRYHKDNKDIYAYWSHASSPSAVVELIGAGRVRIKRFQNSSTVKTSGTGFYRIRARSFVKFLQTL